MVKNSMKQNLNLAGLIVLIVVCALSSMQPIQAIQYSNLYVHVTDCVTGEVIPGAQVTASGNTYQSTVSDGSGIALFSNLLIYTNGVATYQITASKTGYSAKTVSTNVYCSQTHNIYMCLTKNTICGLAVQGTNFHDNTLSSTIVNSGNSQETITVNFYVGSNLVGSTTVNLAAGVSTIVQQSSQVGCGNNQA